MLKKIQETSNFLKNKTGFTPSYGIILGTGLGGLVNEIAAEHTIHYKDIPNFPDKGILPIVPPDFALILG